MPVALLEAASGNRALARKLAEDAGPDLRARVHIALGDHDAAVRARDDAIDARRFGIAQWTDPDFDAVRSDPRFARAVERTGIAAAPLIVWGRWPDGQ